MAPTTHFLAAALPILSRATGFSIVWPLFPTLVAIGSMFFVLALSRFLKTTGPMV